jgi:hypothetical protein
MKRLFVSAAVLPLLCSATAHAETKISSATTAPVRTSTAASGQPDSILIEAGGSITLTTAGAAVTADSSNAVTNAGAINFNNVNNATGILATGQVGIGITNTGAISVVEDYTATDTDSDGDIDGPFAQGTGRYGIRVVSPSFVVGNIVHSGTISVEGNDSAGISVETRQNGSLTTSGSVTVTGDRGTGVRVDSISGDVKILGAVSVVGAGSVGVQTGQVDGTLVLQNGIVATGYRTTTRQTDAVRAKFDADDLLQGGSAVRITGSVGKGVLLDRPPPNLSETDNDEDKDGILDTAESTATVAVYGGAPAIDVGGASAITLGAVGTAGGTNYGFLNRGTVTADGVNDGIAAVALRIGQSTGTVTVETGVYNDSGTIVARAYKAQSTGVLLGPNAVVGTFANSGTVGAEQNGGLHDARALVDQSGSLKFVDNYGVIRAVVNPTTGVAQTGKTIAIDLSANTSGALIRQSKLSSTSAPAIGGDVLFGSGNDRLELLGGTLDGTMNFGGGRDSLLIDGGAVATGRIVDDGTLALEIREGRLALSNTETVGLSTLTLGAKSVLAVAIDPTAAATTRLNVSGAATVATGAQIAVTLTGISQGARSYQILQAGSLTVGQAGATVAGSPYLYQAALRADTTAGAMFVDLRPKTATELGLNRSGSQAYNAVFASLNKDDDIEAAFLAQTTQAGFQGLYDQMLPDHSGGVLMSAAAISAAVSSAVAQPMAIDRSSGTGAWAQEVVFNMQRDRSDALGYKSQGFGFAAGYDLQGEANALGANVSFVTADVKDRGATAGEETSMNLIGAGLYWRVDGGPLQAAVRGGFGYAFLDGDRRLVGDDLNVRAKGSWNAWMVDAYAGVSYEVQVGSLYARPELSASYLRLAEDGYTEKGDNAGFNLTVDKRTADMLTGEALLAIGWKFGDEVYFAPEIKGGYRAKLAGGPGKTTARFEGGQDFTLSPEDAFKGGAVVRAGIRGGAARVLYAVNGGATIDDDYKEYDVRATVRFQF